MNILWILMAVSLGLAVAWLVSSTLHHWRYRKAIRRRLHELYD